MACVCTEVSPTQTRTQTWNFHKRWSCENNRTRARACECVSSWVLAYIVVGACVCELRALLFSVQRAWATRAHTNTHTHRRGLVLVFPVIFVKRESRLGFVVAVKFTFRIRNKLKDNEQCVMDCFASKCGVRGFVGCVGVGGLTTERARVTVCEWLICSREWLALKRN